MIRPQHIKHKILQCICDTDGQTTAEVYESVKKHFTSTTSFQLFMTDHLDLLQIAGWVLIDEAECFITSTGREKLRKLSPGSVGPVVRANLFTVGRGTYDGKELGRTCLREGAYDAYELPSLYGRRRLVPGSSDV